MFLWVAFFLAFLTKCLSIYSSFTKPPLPWKSSGYAPLLRPCYFCKTLPLNVWQCFEYVSASLTVTISPYSVRMRKNADQNNSEYGHYLFIYFYLLKFIFCWRFCCFTASNSYIILRIICSSKSTIHKWN